VQLEVWIPRLDGAEEVFVPRQRQIRIMPTLQQQLNAAYGDGLVDLAEDVFESEHVAVGRAHRTVERAEIALGDADVRVVDVAIDDVGDDPVRMLPGPDGVGQPAERGRRRVEVQTQSFARIEALAREDFVSQRRDGLHRKSAAYRRTRPAR